jgi:hypothetical protein
MKISSSNNFSPKSQDYWLGIAQNPQRTIENSPYFLSRLGSASEPLHVKARVNKQGYDKDDPQQALLCYEDRHPQSILEKAWNEFTDLLFNIFTACVPKTLSLSAGDTKQRINPKIILNIVRESVDAFPELKIRISKEAFAQLHAKDQIRWHDMMAIIRQAQHDFIADKLAKEYPGHIDQDAPTILYTGGRATGLLRVLYCSVDEYLALYWSDWGLMSTDSGSYKAHVFDYITEGHNINWSGNPEDFKTKDYEITEPGEYTFLGRNDRKIWSFEGPCGMVDHGIGDVASMLKFALVSNFSSTLNVEQVTKLLSTQAQAVAHEYAQRIKDQFGSTEITIQNKKHINAQEFKKAKSYFAPIIEKAKQQNLI